MPAIELNNNNNNTYEYPTSYPIGEYYTYYPTWGPTGTTTTTTTGVAGRITPTIPTTVQQQQQTPYGLDDVVITGVSGRFPGFQNIEELVDDLYKPQGRYYGRRMPTPNGQPIFDYPFDYTFFGIDESRVKSMDSGLRALVEVTYEAMFDAGFNSTELKGSKTGVFLGGYGSPQQQQPQQQQQWSISSTYPVQLLNFFEFSGPYGYVDTTISSGLVALDRAFVSISKGECEQAIVGGIHNGTVGVVFLQKTGLSRRFYAKIKTTKTIQTPIGEKDFNFAYQNGEEFGKYLREVYSESQIDPSLIQYVESHNPELTTTTKPYNETNEYRLITDVFGRYRQIPLFVGSTKAYGYHDHGIVSLIKMLIAAQRGILPKTLKFQHPTSGEYLPLQETKSFNGGLMALNSFGYPGASVHVVLQPNCEQFQRKFGQDLFWNQSYGQYLQQPRLFHWSATNEQGLVNTLEKMHLFSNDLPTHVLLNPNSLTTPSTHPYRGFTILNGTKKVREYKKCSEVKKPIWFLFNGLGSQWTGMGKDLMQIEFFKQRMTKIAEFLKPKCEGFDLIRYLTTGVYDKQYITLLITSIQVAFVDLMKYLGVEPDGIVGYSFGEFAAAYTDGALSFEETLMSSYYLGKYIYEAKLPESTMAVIGLSWFEARNECPQSIVPSIYESKDSCVISGPKKAVQEYLEVLKRRGVEAKEIESYGLGLHSYLMSPIVSQYKLKLESLIREPKLRSGKYYTNSYNVDPQQPQGPLNYTRYASPDYFVNTIFSPSYFYQTVTSIPPNAITIELGPSSYLRQTLLKTLGNNVYINFMKPDSTYNLEHFWMNIGRLYNEGINVDSMKLFFGPSYDVKNLYPVPHTTRFLSPFVSWNRPSYNGSWYGSKYDVPTYGEQFDTTYPSSLYTTTYPTSTTPTPYTYTYNIDTDEDGEFGYLNGNTINGKIMFPTTGYLYLVWKALAESRKVKFYQLPVGFENVEYYQPIVIGTPKINMTVRFVDYETGRFEVVYGNKVVVSGRIYVPEQPWGTYDVTTYTYPNWDEKKEHEVLDLQEIYRDFRYRGYDYSDFFQNIYKIGVDGKQAQLCWEGLWIPFLESMIQVHTFGKTNVAWPTKIHSIRINPTIHGKFIKSDMKKFLTKHDYSLEQPEQFGTLTVVYDPYTSTYKSGGVEMTGLFTLPLPEELKIEQPSVIERVNFVPYFERYGEQQQFGMVDDEYKKNFEFFDLYLNEVKYYINEIIKKVDLLTNPPARGLFDDFSALYAPIVKLSTKTTSTGRLIDGKFLQLLKSVCEYPIDSEFTKKVRGIFGGNSYGFYKLWNDEPLFQTQYGGDNRYTYLKSLLETVLENVPVFESQPRIKVLEIAPQYHSFSPRINEFLNAHPSVEVDYHYVPVGEYLPEVHSQWIQNSPFPMTKLDWNIQQQEMPTGEFKDYDLIIFNSSIGYTKLFNNDRIMFKSWFKSLTDAMLKPQGFFMLHENVNYRDILMRISKFQQQIFNTPLSVYKYQDEEEWKSYFNDYFYPVSIKHDGFLSSYMLYRKPYGTQVTGTQITRMPERYQEIYVDNTYDWVAKVQKTLEDTTIDRVWIICEDLPTSGVIGLVNCLRHETFGDRIRCVFIADQAYSSKGWKTQFEILRRADLLMNVFKNGRWGSYKHLFDFQDMESQQIQEGIKYAYVDWLQRGDLSTLQWMQSPEPYATGNNQYLVDVYYGGLNYRDYLIATGALYPEHLITYKKHYDHVFGMEFSGYVSDKRYMGITPGRGLSTVLSVNDRYLWEVPTNWTLEQAATIPLSYSQAYYALVVRGGLKNGETVLIHSGATPFGQAAISIALGFNCKVFTTYTRPEEREFLMQMYPGKLMTESFVNINDDCYDSQILRYTKGVNVVINYLNGERYEPSIRCLLPYGRFVEMSDYVVKTDQTLWKKFNNKNIVYLNFYFDSLFDTDSTYEWEQVYKLVSEGIRTGIVRPLIPRVFDRYQIQDAFQQLINGPSFDKVLVRICEMKNIHENSYRVQSTPINAFPKLWFSPYMTYIIHQGLTPFGLELTQWMVQRGAKKIMLVSENTTRFAYEQRKLSLLRTMYDATIIISTYDPSDEGECILLMKEAVELSENKKIGGIFSIEIPFQQYSFDKLYDSQFQFLMDRRYQTIYNLDKYSREYTEAYFVVFSSLFSGRGFENASLHGYMHSAIERLCELRRSERRHAVAIQWGQIEDHFECENLYGTVPQSVLSTLKTLEHILLRSQYSTIWSTYVQDCKNGEIKADDLEDYVYVPTQQQQQQQPIGQYYNRYTTVYPTTNVPTYRLYPYQPYQQQYTPVDQYLPSYQPQYYPTTNTTYNNNNYGLPTYQSTTPLYEFVLRLLKIQDEKYIQFNTPLVQYGMTMKLAKQLKDIFEYQHRILMSIEEIQQLTFGKLRSMDLTRPYVSLQQQQQQQYPVLPQQQQQPFVPRFAGEFYKQSTKYQYLMPKKVFYALNDSELKSNVQPIFVIHPIEGHVNMLKNWAQYINHPVIGIQYTQEAMKYETIEQLADFYIQQINNLYGAEMKFHLIGYSFGGSVAFEMINRIPTKGRIPSLTFIDGSYMFVNQHLSQIRNSKKTVNVALMESEFLYGFISQYIGQFGQQQREQFIQELMQWDNFESRVYYTVNYLIKNSVYNFDIEDLTFAAKSYVKRMFMAYTYKPTQIIKNQQNMKVLLVRPKQRTEFSDLLGEDYGLNGWIDGKILIKKIEFTEQQQQQLQQQFQRGQWIDTINGHMFATSLTGLLGLSYNYNNNYNLYGKF